MLVKVVCCSPSHKSPLFAGSALGFGRSAANKSNAIAHALAVVACDLFYRVLQKARCQSETRTTRVCCFVCVYVCVCVCVCLCVSVCLCVAGVGANGYVETTPAKQRNCPQLQQQQTIHTTHMHTPAVACCCGGGVGGGRGDNGCASLCNGSCWVDCCGDAGESSGENSRACIQAHAGYNGLRLRIEFESQSHRDRGGWCNRISSTATTTNTCSFSSHP